jgi:hypothetical protein
MRKTMPASRGFSVSAVRAAVCCAALLAVMGALPTARAQDQYGLRNLSGKVLDAKDAPISGAVVYLQSSRSNDIKSFISTANGSYRFADISADTDYTVWAAFKGKKSPTREVSSFDTRKNVFIDLHVKE